jgi:NADP-dependent 3-hydroxy acid dehydrogenase YdfG
MDSGRVAVIIGGVNGIGLAVATLCLKIGMKVAIADIDQAGLDKVQTQHGDAAVLCVKCDATNRGDVKAFADKVYNKWNDVGLLFNNTGVMRSDSAYATSLEDWKLMFEVTFFAGV